MKPLPLSLVVLGVLLFIVSGYSQTGYLEKAKNYTIESGLPSNSVYSICEDDNGFIWAATSEGLCKLDGYNIKVYRNFNANKTFIKRNFIRSILKARDGNLWIGMENGLAYFQQGTGQFITNFHIKGGVLKVDLLEQTFVPYYELADGKILALNSFKNLVIDPVNLTIEPLFKEDSPLFNAYPCAVDDNRILFANHGSIYEYGPDKKSVRLIMTTPYVEFIMPISSTIDKNILYFCYLRSIVKINLQRGSIVKEATFFDKNDEIGRIKSIRIDPTKRFLIVATSGKGLFFLNKDLEIIHQTQSEKNNSRTIGSNIIECCYFDRNYNLWIGTDLGGMSCIAYNNKFGLYSDILRDQFITSIGKYKSKLFIATYNDHLYEVDIMTKSYQAIPLRADPKNIRSICNYGEYLLLGSEKGLIAYHVDQRTEKLILPPNNCDNNFLNLRVTEDNNVFACSQCRIYHIKLNNDTWLVDTILYPINSISTIEGFNNDLVICQKFPDLGFHAEPISPIASKYKNFTILLRSFQAVKHKNFIWVTGSDGLLKLDNNYNILDTFNYTNSKIQTRIMSMELTGDLLWLSTNNNFLRFDISTETFTSFGTNDGLPSLEFVSNSSFKDEEGYLYFGSIEGITRFHPDSIRLNTKTSKCLVTGLMIFDQPYIDSNKQYIDSITVNYKQNTMLLEFSSPQPANQDKIQYSYQINNGTWVDVGNENKIWLANMGPGVYTINIKSTSIDGIWGAPQTLLYIRITPPFWRTNWFLFIMSFCCIGIISIIVSRISSYKQRQKILQLEKQEALNKERLRISRDLHDELGSGLSKIKFLSDLSLTETNKEEQQKKLLAISETSAHVVTNMKDLIWLINSEETTFDTLCAGIREYATDYLEEFDISIKIEFPENIPTFIITKTAYRHLFMIVKESLQNVVKHASANQVIIQLELNEQLMLSISDNGRGFELSNHIGNGLKNLQERARSIGGRCEIKSENGKGCTITVIAPVSSIQNEQIPL